jgi:heparinase II/III-like protein
MQSITWYIKRIQLMSTKEIYWRISSLIIAWLERFRVQLGLVPQVIFIKEYDLQKKLNPGFTVFNGEVTRFSLSWEKNLFEKANLVLENKLSYFDLKEHHLETPINWHKDHSANIFSSLDHILSVNYRDFEKNGDCKLVWEPNRHHQLVVLARAYKVSGEIKYAQGVIELLSAWLESNPYGKGMNWRSPLELSIRLINWVWAIDLIKNSGLFCGNIKQKVLASVFLHCRDVSGKFSQGTSANNHLVGEAAGVYIAASYFNMIADSAKWREKSKQVLEREIQAQTFSDGCTKEHAFSYQFFVYQFYLFTALVGQWSQDSFSNSYRTTLHSIAKFIATIAQGGNDYPMLGDQDDGYVLDLGDHVHNINALCDISAYLFSDDVFLSSISKPSESAFWLFNGRAEREHIQSVNFVYLQSKQFESSGYFLLQGGNVEEKNQASILFDCAELGYTAIAAHGHADALSFVLRINNNDLFVDTGTYDYFSYPKWRDHFRKTKAHNCLEVDGLDQSVITGPFMWEQHAKTNLNLWQPNTTGGKVVANHNGYQRLSAPLIHERSIELNTSTKAIEIIDSVQTQGAHHVALYFHFSEHCKDIKFIENVCTLSLGNDQIKIELPDSLKVEIIKGQIDDMSDEPSLGWLSRGYHQKTPITTIALKGKIATNTTFKTVIAW